MKRASAHAHPTRVPVAVAAYVDHTVAELLHEHGTYLRSVCRRLTRCAEDADDVFQDTLVAVHSNIDRFRGEASIRTWLFAVARSQACRLARRDLRHRGRLDVLRASQPGSNAGRPVSDRDDFERRDLQWILNRGLTQLAELDRKVLWLRDCQGLSAEETGLLLGITIPAVKSRLLRSRRRMRELLNEPGAAGPKQGAIKAQTSCG